MTTITKAGREFALLPPAPPRPPPRKRGPKPRDRAGYWTPERFDAAGRKPSRSLTAARRHLVDGITQERAAAEAGISRNALKLALLRLRRAAGACPTCGQPLRA